ncbi:DUF72 domain-containing protein [Desulforhopalus sp. IMCC35007]|uniref:DUF72 domain-containing protein n=1 Tax=Desulforhopalus sp. IMCC35007 TaxID=2569543 RepID=UPI0010AE296C|nr:DUF72 domain-containing protein [Desulforhopalus sp. IMCC35007]TKB05950.1 DUF72 domain-containing protein [Desulforhopalus sp. IMCC35007]
MDTKHLLKIGTCSWKYESWRGLIYSRDNEINFLQEYSEHFQTVEVDQWFWSLFKGNAVVMPKANVVDEYATSVPPGFTFSIKVPNSITLTHHYNKPKNTALVPNPYFLSTELMGKFLQTLEPLGDHIGPLIFQFEYLNKIKMASMVHFIERLQTFFNGLPEGYQYCIESRNPNYLKNAYFDFLAEHHLGHVFLQGYYMPSMFELYEKFKNRLSDPVVLRLHGRDRRGIEERTDNVWDTIVDPRDDELLRLKSVVNDLLQRQHQVFINVNNHYEGSAPRTIEKIKVLLQLD